MFTAVMSRMTISWATSSSGRSRLGVWLLVGCGLRAGCGGGGASSSPSRGGLHDEKVAPKRVRPRRGGPVGKAADFRAMVERDGVGRGDGSARTRGRAGRGRRGDRCRPGRRRQADRDRGAGGIGKTSLLAEGRARAAASGLTVLYARASELEAAFSFGVVRQLFEAAVATASEEEQSTAAWRRRRAGRALVRLRRQAEGGSEEDVYALLHGLYWLTVNLAESRPLALAVDDVQWSDPPSLRWLAYSGAPARGRARLRA